MSARVVVICGASSGIGAALARLLGAQGTSLVLAARREDELNSVAAESGANVLVLAADLTSRSEVTRVVQAAVTRFGHIDVWINNVGKGISRMPTALTDEDIDSMMLINVKTALYGMQEVLPHFAARGAGQIINISSMLGRMPMALQRSAYSASKHFLNALTAMVRDELKTSHPGVVVSLVSPGIVATDFGLSARHGGIDSRHMPGTQTAEEVASVIASVMESRATDVYTRPDGAAMVAGYYAEARTESS